MTDSPMIEVTLLPCPFCGDAARPALVQAGGIEWAQVECVNRDCCAVGPTPASKAEAITAWNTRANQTPARPSSGAPMSDDSLSGIPPYIRRLAAGTEEYNDHPCEHYYAELIVSLEACLLAANQAPAPTGDVELADALARAYTQGAKDVHREWGENPGEAPGGDGDFAEAAGDYARWVIDNTASPPPDASPADDVVKSISVAEEWVAYMDEAVSNAPEPLRQLGEYLAGVLDEDQWKTAERFLNAAAIRPAPPEALAAAPDTPAEQIAENANCSTPAEGGLDMAPSLVSGSWCGDTDVLPTGAEVEVLAVDGAARVSRGILAEHGFIAGVPGRTACWIRWWPAESDCASYRSCDLADIDLADDDYDLIEKEHST